MAEQGWDCSTLPVAPSRSLHTVPAALLPRQGPALAPAALHGGQKTLGPQICKEGHL